MNKYIVAALIIFPVLLAGCTQNTISQAFSNVYQGYPCNNHCDTFKDGYEIAKARQYTADASCNNIAKNSQIGCLSYVQDYRYEHQTAGGYVFSGNSHVSN